jgi:hypothetical protein
MNFKFDWQKAQGFVHWLLPTALAGLEDLEPLSELTDGFTKCELGITLNGVPMDAERFLASLEANYNNQTMRQARVMLDDLVDFAGINNMLLNIQEAMDREVRKRFDDAGIPIDEWNEEY